MKTYTQGTGFEFEIVDLGITKFYMNNSVSVEELLKILFLIIAPQKFDILEAYLFKKKLHLNFAPFI